MSFDYVCKNCEAIIQPDELSEHVCDRPGRYIRKDLYEERHGSLDG